MAYDTPLTTLKRLKTFRRFGWLVWQVAEAWAALGIR
jgi:hypothetical protein